MLSFLKKWSTILVWIYISVAFLSYCPTDTSWSIINHSQNPVHNFCGKIGSYIVDMVYLFFGYSIYPIIGFTILSFYAKHVSRMSRCLLHLLSSLCIIFTISMFKVNNPSWAYVSYSGSIGFLLHTIIPNINTTLCLTMTCILHLILIYCYYKKPLEHLTKNFYIKCLNIYQSTMIFITRILKYILPRKLIPKSLYLNKYKVKKLHNEEFTNKNLLPDNIPKDAKKCNTDNQEVLRNKYKQHIFSITDQKTTEKKLLNKTIPSIVKHNDLDNFQKPNLKFFKNKKLNPIRNTSHHINTSRKLETILNDFGIEVKILNHHVGPVVTLYELDLTPGTKSSRVINLSYDIARSLCVSSIRISVIPGKKSLCLEIPNQERDTVVLKDFFESDDFNSGLYNIPIALGCTIFGKPFFADLTKMPHLLIAGTTGSGKSVAINVMILSIIYSFTPQECKLILVDPKMLELSMYDHIPYLLTPVVTEPRKAVNALKWLTKEMENRYKNMSLLSVRNIEGYNKLIKEKAHHGHYVMNNTIHKVLPYIVVVIDEMADLMLVTGKEIETLVQRLSQMARASGIHLIMATQRPSVDVITGVIKANFPTRVSFAVSSKIDSRTILGEQGAEQLLGKGDMLYMTAGHPLMRLHAPFVEDYEVNLVVDYIKTQGEPEYQESIDELSQENDYTENSEPSSDQDIFQNALSIIYQDKRISVSYLQRKLKIGFNRAASIIEEMEDKGIISKPNAIGKREILKKKQEVL
ncbi:MAG: cell division protein FtsK, putative [Candidatus Xenolissoclinum pacificiensis L6]|uniref:DNA translocase FtsK n=1 Tax=Candidatus Xenolissoclinum pacificiensis L6 TaxID=1401685 RepID=W2V0W3_9RICK|nr:MAG: cell division protein FtsK, putative [Candidatus Xenolissoclinum pacificiensis L6]